jgi:hypothetical protein
MADGRPFGVALQARAQQLRNVVMDLPQVVDDALELLARDVLELHEVHHFEDLVLDLLAGGRHLLDGTLDTQALGPFVAHHVGDELLLAGHQAADLIQLVHDLVGLTFGHGGDGIQFGDHVATAVLLGFGLGRGLLLGRRRRESRRLRSLGGHLGLLGGFSASDEEGVDFGLVHGLLLTQGGTRSFL